MTPTEVIGNLVYCSWKCRMVQSLWKSISQFFNNNKHISIPFPSNCIPRYENICPQKDFCRILTVDWSKITPNETTDDHHCMIYSYNGKWHSNKNEWTTNTCKNRWTSKTLYWGKEANTKECTLYDFTYMNSRTDESNLCW